MIALVLGGAGCLWEDVEAASALIHPADCLIVAVNDAGVWWPGRLDAWVTMHADEMPYRIRKRTELGHPAGFTTWTRPYPRGMEDREAHCDRVIGGWGGGSSGLVAVGVAIQHRCSVILCGVPLDERPHFNRTGAWEGAAGFREGWTDRSEALAPLVRSLSGWTRETFGAPTQEWVDAARATRVA